MSTLSFPLSGEFRVPLRRQGFVDQLAALGSMLTPELSWHLFDCLTSLRCERPKAVTQTNAEVLHSQPALLAFAADAN